MSLIYLILISTKKRDESNVSNASLIAVGEEGWVNRYIWTDTLISFKDHNILTPKKIL